jgi:hypothetical protein
MAQPVLESVVRQLHDTAADPSDAELVRQFVADHGPAAFEALVWGHGPLVRAACRRALGKGADDDNAFQPTFLVLARRAALWAKRSLIQWIGR